MYHQPLVRAACAVAFSLVRLSGRCLAWKPRTDGLRSIGFTRALWVNHVSTTLKGYTDIYIYTCACIQTVLCTQAFVSTDFA